MAWRVELTATARKQLLRLDRPVARRITTFLQEIAQAEDGPRSRGKPLSGPLEEFWRYRVGDYRLVCENRDPVLCVLVLRIAHCGDVDR